jgi:hypothetical protein
MNRSKDIGTQNLWKLVVETQLEPDQIEQAVAEVPDITEPTSPIRGVELQRIDVVDGRSFVFVTGSEKSARALERCLKVGAKGMTVRCAETTAKELYANEPPKG